MDKIELPLSPKFEDLCEWVHTNREHFAKLGGDISNVCIWQHYIDAQFSDSPYARELAHALDAKFEYNFSNGNSTMEFIQLHCNNQLHLTIVADLHDIDGFRARRELLQEFKEYDSDEEAEEREAEEKYLRDRI